MFSISFSLLIRSVYWENAFYKKIMQYAFNFESCFSCNSVSRRGWNVYWLLRKVCVLFRVFTQINCTWSDQTGRTCVVFLIYVHIHHHIYYHVLLYVECLALRLYIWRKKISINTDTECVFRRDETLQNG